MTIRHGILGAAVLAVASLGASAKETIRVAHLLDASHDAAFWAIANGKVTSPDIEVEAKALSIPALIQATASKQYDVVQTAVMAIPRAASKGLELKVLATGLRSHNKPHSGDIWVKADSPIRSAADLKGKKIGVYSLNSTGITLVRIALWKKHGLNVSYKDGDMEWQEVPAPTIPAALASGHIDAGTLIHSQAFKAKESGEFRSVVPASMDNVEVFGVPTVAAVYVGYPEKLAAKPEAYKAFLELFDKSVKYAKAHPDEVFTAVGKAKNVDPKFFSEWFETYSDIPVVISRDDRVAIEKVWGFAKEMGILAEYPAVDDVIWEHALTE
ncbi:MAG: ABC transporter substrate-binding protein [Ectothiorhodospiraceae bacterium]|nr:ABC transporter substrate-binding protein [Ectothiorhodospiraceae bacterium]